jgi:short-subunit dehydrogenase
MKYAIVTGASRGLGRLMVQELVHQGYCVWGLARSEKELRETQATLGDKISQFLIQTCDLSEPENLQSLSPQLLKKTPNIHLVVHNAGIEHYQHYEDYDLSTLKKIQTVNLLAPMELTRLLISTLKKNQGQVISIASLAGKKGVVFNAPYSATKAGLLLWADALNQEFSGQIRFSTLCPGFMDETGMYFDTKVGSVSFLLGTNSVAYFLKSFRQSLKTQPKEMIINKGPMRLLLSLAQLAPSLGDLVMKWLKIKQMNEKRIGLSRL